MDVHTFIAFYNGVKPLRTIQSAENPIKHSNGARKQFVAERFLDLFLDEDGTQILGQDKIDVLNVLPQQVSSKKRGRPNKAFFHPIRDLIVKGWKHKDIAVHLGISVKTIQRTLKCNQPNNYEVIDYVCN